MLRPKLGTNAELTAKDVTPHPTEYVRTRQGWDRDLAYQNSRTNPVTICKQPFIMIEDASHMHVLNGLHFRKAGGPAIFETFEILLTPSIDVDTLACHRSSRSAVILTNI